MYFFCYFVFHFADESDSDDDIPITTVLRNKLNSPPKIQCYVKTL